MSNVQSYPACRQGLYRVLPGLEQEKKLEKKGRGWHPKGATPAAA